MIKKEVQDITRTSFFHFLPFGSRTRSEGVKNDFDVKIVFHISVFDTPEYVQELKSFRKTLPNPDIPFSQLVSHWLRDKIKVIPSILAEYKDEYGNPVKIDLVIELTG